MAGRWSLRRGRSGDREGAPALLDRPGVLEVGLGVPILVVLAVVIFTAGGSPPPPADPTAAKPSATASIGSVDDTEPTVDGEVDEGLEAERANAPTAQQLQRRLKRKGLVLVDGPPPAMDLFFKVASFNVLGASHTRGPDRRKRFAGAEARMPGQIQMLESKGVTVAGLQEFQAPQVNSFLARVGSRWDVYPGTSLGARLADNSIIWRSDLWEAVKKQTTPVPYFRGRMVPMPQVLLRHRTTRQLVWIGNFHNPANVVGNAAGHRARAVDIEARLVRELGADGTPVIITGDMNDRREFACPFTAKSGAHSADGASTDASGNCLVPRRMNVDWVLGNDKVQFSDFEADFGSEHRRLSDHPFISATATLPGSTTGKQCEVKLSSKGFLWFCPRRG